MAFELLAGALIGFGASELVGSMGKTPKAPDVPTLPSTQTAGQDASAAVSAQRKAALATGGLTDYTGGSGIILGSDVKSVSLVGG